MMQVLLETGTRVQEYGALRVKGVSLAERAIVIEIGNGDKRREMPMRPELARFAALHVSRRRSGPLYVPPSMHPVVILLDDFDCDKRRERI